MLSEIDLPLMKADWFLLTIEGSIDCTLLAKIFEMHLYNVLQQEMGL